MGIVTAFLAGYLVGTNAGREGYQDLLAAVREVRESPEFDGLMHALRAHASATLGSLSELLAVDHDGPITPQSIRERVEQLVSQRGSTSRAS